jgi:hypothetical protein
VEKVEKAEKPLVQKIKKALKANHQEQGYK